MATPITMTINPRYLNRSLEIVNKLQATQNEKNISEIALSSSLDSEFSDLFFGIYVTDENKKVIKTHKFSTGSLLMGEDITQYPRIYFQVWGADIDDPATSSILWKSRISNLYFSETLEEV